MKTFIQLLSGILLLYATACGRNVVETYAPANDQEKAELDMEASRYEAASEKLLKVLSETPENYNARSLLAAAYAARAGITTLSLIKNATSLGSSGATGLRGYTTILPTATSDVLAFMELACDAMAKIPVEDRTTEMKLQYGLFFSSYAFLQIKYFLDNPSALASLSVNDALKLVETLAKASEAGGSSPLSKAAETLSTTLASTPGSNVDKVKAALGPSTPASGG